MLSGLLSLISLKALKTTAQGWSDLIRVSKKIIKKKIEFINKSSTTTLDSSLVKISVSREPCPFVDHQVHPRNRCQHALKKSIHERVLSRIIFTSTTVIAIALKVISFTCHLEALVLAHGSMLRPFFHQGRFRTMGNQNKDLETDSVLETHNT